MRYFALLLIGMLVVAPLASAAEKRPNFVWIIAEDMSANFGCYGETAIKTPNVDRLAKDGARFTNAIVTCPVCSPSRSALVTGCYQTSIGAHQHRSGRGTLKIHLPKHLVLAPKIFQDAGYLTLNLTVQDFLRTAASNPQVKVAKTDYNFDLDASVYDHLHWSARKKGQPFFVQIQLRGGKLRSTGITKNWPEKVREDLGSVTPISAVTLPPYLPDDPVIRQDWAQYLDAVRYTDWEVGKIIQRLQDAGELESTYVYFITDHGISHVRNKQFLYEGGVHVPLIVRGPGVKPGSVRNDPVEHIDLVATSLARAGIAIPKWMNSKDVLAKNYQPRKYVFSGRDRCDETLDRIRCVRSERYKLIHNFYPKRPYLQPNAYKDNKPILQAMRRMHKSGKLNEAQSLIMARARPVEELYDLHKDPYELDNLAKDPKHADVLRTMRAQLSQWIERTGDHGVNPETAEAYDSDMAVYLQRLKKRRPMRLKEIEANIALMKKWAKEGR